MENQYAGPVLLFIGVILLYVFVRNRIKNKLNQKQVKSITMEKVITSVIGTRNNGTRIVKNQITGSARTNYVESAHKEFTREERKNAERDHKLYKKEVLQAFTKQRNTFISHMLEAKRVNLNISKISLI